MVSRLPVFGIAHDHHAGLAWQMAVDANLDERGCKRYSETGRRVHSQNRGDEKMLEELTYTTQPFKY